MLNSFLDKFIFTNSLQYKHNNFFLADVPFAIIPLDALAGIAKLEDRELNFGIYKSVKESTQNSLRRQFQIDFGVEGQKGLDFMNAFFTASGWGEIQVTDFDEKKSHAMVSVSNSAVAQNVKGAKLPVDTFMRGFLAGVFSIYFKSDVDCVETKCLGQSASHCDFVIKPLSEFKFDNPLTRSQLRVE